MNEDWFNEQWNANNILNDPGANPGVGWMVPNGIGAFNGGIAGGGVNIGLLPP